MSSAHEGIPAIGDLTFVGDQIELELRVDAEALISDMDQSDLTDNIATPNNDLYDELRALDPVALEQEFRTFWPVMAQGLTISAPDTAELQLMGLSIADEPELKFPRKTTLSITAILPADVDAVTVTWPAVFGTLILRQEGVEDPYVGSLTKGATSDPIPRNGGVSKTWGEALIEYIPVGFDHIIPKGLDHILFVLGLFFLAAGLRPLLWQVTAFTLAHTVTLALGALGWVTVPGSIVEPLIAASIVFVAVENILAKGLSPWRPVVIFAFGLLHGLGFASVLGDFGLPSGQFIPALIGFNIGVEIGQLAVILVAFLAVGLWFRHKPWYRARIAIPASVAIAIVGAWWFVERVFL